METRSFMTCWKTSTTSESARNGKCELATPQDAWWIRCDVHLMKCWNVPTCKELLAGLDLKEPRSLEKKRWVDFFSALCSVMQL